MIHFVRIIVILVITVGGSDAAPVGASMSGVTSQGRRDSIGERCKPDVVCSEKDLHGVRICGTNGRTYANPCELRLAVCIGVPVQMHGIGECLLSERCRLERDFQTARIAENASLYINEFIPDCDETSGLYTSIQCHTAIGYCWCSTIKGTAISGTSVSIDSGDRPDCTTHEHRNLSLIHVDASGSITYSDHNNGTIAEECSSADRVQYTSGLLEVFEKAYNNALNRTNDDETLNNDVNSIDGASSPESNDITLKFVIVWRFMQLDTDNNGRLTPTELENEHRLTLRIIRPKACGRDFARFCDKNSDRLIDLQEWTNCLNSGSTDKVPSCAAERQKLQRETDKAYLTAMFMPSCSTSDNHLYEQMQCHIKVGRRLCWCVDAVTGQPSDSGLVTSVDECVVAATRTKKQHFQIKEMRKEDPSFGSGPKRRKPAIAKWKFAQLDTNHDGMIERSEWKTLRAKARKLKDVRKCGRNFLRSCDRDKDRKITKKEWMACTVHAYKHAKSNQANPFLTLLKPLD